MGTNDDYIARLESEIRYLKRLLDENGILYDYEASVGGVKREEPVEIEFPALTAEHAIQFYSYIRFFKPIICKLIVYTFLLLKVKSPIVFSFSLILSPRMVAFLILG